MNRFVSLAAIACTCLLNSHSLQAQNISSPSATAPIPEASKAENTGNITTFGITANPYDRVLPKIPSFDYFTCFGSDSHPTRSKLLQEFGSRNRDASRTKGAVSISSHLDTHSSDISKRFCAAPSENNPDKGLQHRFHIALGIATISHSDGGSDESGFAAKADWSYFRPTRHEAVVTLWFVNASGANTEAITTEYRWRFGGHGIAYYALGLGVATGNGLQSGVFTDGFGVELGRFSLEARSLASGSDAAYMFMLGARF